MACSGCAKRRAKLKAMFKRQTTNLTNLKNRQIKSQEVKDAKTSEK